MRDEKPKIVINIELSDCCSKQQFTVIVVGKRFRTDFTRIRFLTSVRSFVFLILLFV